MNDELLKIVRYNRGLAELINSFFTFCPNFPSDYTLTEVDIFKIVFSRYTKRTMYYAENYLQNLERIEVELKEKSHLNSKNFLMPISDAIFFDFDAFLFSSKSIVEKKMINRASGMHLKIKNEFLTYAKDTLNNFIEPYLKPFRNEVVHINNFGSSFGSLVHIKDNKLFFKAFSLKNEIDLHEIFITVLKNISEIIKNIAKFTMLHDCYTFGFPDKTKSFNTGYHNYSFSDFIDIEKHK